MENRAPLTGEKKGVTGKRTSQKNVATGKKKEDEKIRSGQKKTDLTYRRKNVITNVIKCLRLQAGM